MHGTRQTGRANQRCATLTPAQAATVASGNRDLSRGAESSTSIPILGKKVLAFPQIHDEGGVKDGGRRAAAGRVRCCHQPPEPAPHCREPIAACGAQAWACPGRTALTAARRARRWKKHYSNTWKRHYYHNFKTGKQLWEHPGKVGDSHAAQGGGAGSGTGDSASRKRALSDDGGGLAAGGGAEGAAKKAKPSTVDFSVVKEAGAAKILAGMPPIGKLEDSPELAVARHSEVPPNCHVSLHQSPMRSDNVPRTRTRARTHAIVHIQAHSCSRIHPSIHLHPYLPVCVFRCRSWWSTYGRRVPGARRFHANLAMR